MALNNPLTIHPGKITPLGASINEKKVNFAIKSSSSHIELLIFEMTATTPSLHITLNEEMHKMDDTWAISIEGLQENFDYTWKIQDLFLCDPYAKALASPSSWKSLRTENAHFGRARFLFPRHRPEKKNNAPFIPYTTLIIYEMHVRGFTQHLSSHMEMHGTYLGVIEKIPHLLELGVNAVELLPIYEFDENSYLAKDPLTGLPLCDYWGYNPLHFFCPMKRYAFHKEVDSFSTDFKAMIAALHAAGIEVFLDVVYNHTGEGGKTGKTYSLKGLDKEGYYLLDADGAFSNYSGTGNTLCCNEEPGLSLILDSMRHFVKEYHIDGFRFDLASILTRDKQGNPLDPPPLLQALAQDPILQKIKLIAEPWDASGLYQLGEFPKWGPFLEWNGKFRDTVRRFLKGTDGESSAFATALCGSEDLYRNFPLGPCHSVNFITCHDGFSLHDLMSYQTKHNIHNGEENRDGCSQNDNWNCGAEGETPDIEIMKLREKQMRNHALALFLSLGVPMFLMGDEYGQSKGGNNNAWCQDNRLNWFDWNELSRKKEGFFRFVKKMIAFRKTMPHLQRDAFLQPGEISWHGVLPNEPDWSLKSRLVAFSRSLSMDTEMFVAFHPGHENILLKIPSPSQGGSWKLLIDTHQPPPLDFLDAPKELDSQEEYLLASYSAILLIN